MGFLKSIEQSMIFYPQKLSFDYKFDFPYPFEEVTLTMKDGVKVNSVLFFAETKPSQGIILYFHGNAGSLAGWGYVAGDFLPMGWDVFVTDYRSYGKSGGRPDEDKLHSDARELYLYLSERFPEKEILPYGRSIGTGIGAKLARDQNTKRLILETPYTSFPELAKVYYSFLPSFLLGYKLDTWNYVQEFPGHTLVLHGDRDDIIPVGMARKFAGMNPRVRYVEVPGGGHNDLWEYRIVQDSVKVFLREF